MHNDDRQVGRILSRREVLALVGAAGAAVLAGCGPASDAAQPTSAATPVQSATAAPVAQAAPSATAAPVAEASTAAPSATAAPVAEASTAPSATLPACVVSPELAEGPYFVDAGLNRADIRSDPTSGELRPGVPLALTLRVAQVSASACAPLAGALVDIWQCDALGVYSDVGEASGQLFLRGQQVTDASGAASFITIYPGWYPGRTVHIHFKVRAAAGASQTYEFASQLFFDEALSDTVFALAPYVGRGQSTTRNAADNTYAASGGQLLLALAPAAEGYSANFDIGLEL